MRLKYVHDIISSSTIMSTSGDLPDQHVIEKVCDLELFDAKGKKIKFNTIIAGKKVIVVFIRMSIPSFC